MVLDQSTLSDLWNGDRSICFFVHQGQCYWVLDHKYNFALDAEKDYRAYRDAGHITDEDYIQSCRMFRNGILKLTAHNFLQYIDDPKGTAIVCESLESIFRVDVQCDPETLLECVEDHYLSGGDLSPESFRLANVMASRLPLFYINFDRQIFMHMDTDRFHEALAYPDWLAKCADFSFLIPDAERYWARHGDFWKFRFV